MELLANMEVFVAVAKVKGFRKAAEQLDMPNSTVSRRITELERTVGLRLFHRSTRKVELTEAGLAYFRRCEGIVAEAHLAHEALTDTAGQPAGTLRVSMPVDLAIDYLAPAIKAFGERYPRIDFELDLTSRRVDLVADGYDCAIRMGVPDAAQSALIARQIGLLPRYLYASPAYLAGAPPLSHPDDLVHHDCLIVSTTRQQVRWTLLSERDPAAEPVQVAVSGRYAMNNVGLIRKMAELGMGVAVSAGAETGADFAAGQLRRVLPDWRCAPIPVYAMLESRLIPSRVRLFIEHMAAALAAFA